MSIPSEELHKFLERRGYHLTKSEKSRLDATLAVILLKERKAVLESVLNDMRNIRND